MECNFDGNTDRLFCLGAYYFFKSSRKRSKIKELTFEDNVVEQDRLACMWEEGLTDPLAEQTRHKALTEIIGQEKAIRALRAALCGPNPQHVLIYGPPGVGKTAAARLILEEAKAREESPFRQKAKFVEIDATALQFDERNIADPLLGSVHDPIYQGGGGVLAGGHPPAQTGCGLRDARRHPDRWTFGGGGDVPRALFGLYGNARAKYAGADRRDRSAWADSARGRGGG